MKKDILNLVNKKVKFPLKKVEYDRTIKYYLGNSEKVIQSYVNFLNN